MTTTGPSHRSAATPQYLRSGLVANGLETSKIPAVNSRGPSVARRGLAHWGCYFGGAQCVADQPEAPRDRELFFLSGNVVPFFPEVRLDFIHFHPGVVFHLDKQCTCGSIIGIGKIEGRQERASA